MSRFKVVQGFALLHHDSRVLGHFVYPWIDILLRELSKKIWVCPTVHWQQRSFTKYDWQTMTIKQDFCLDSPIIIFTQTTLRWGMHNCNSLQCQKPVLFCPKKGIHTCWKVPSQSHQVSFSGFAFWQMVSTGENIGSI